jgi:hypothetical protein
MGEQISSEMRKNLAGAFYGSMLGLLLGGYLWIIIVGMVLKTWVWVVLPLCLGTVAFLGAWIGYRRNPRKITGYVGLVLIWVVLSNMVAIDVLYDKIPYTLGEITTGKEMINPHLFQYILLGVSVIGFLMVLRGFNGIASDGKDKSVKDNNREEDK